MGHPGGKGVADAAFAFASAGAELAFPMMMKNVDVRVWRLVGGRDRINC